MKELQLSENKDLFPDSVIQKLAGYTYDCIHNLHWY